MAEKKTNFSLTCNLLSQYIKEKGSFGDSSLGMTISARQQTKVLHRQPSTMSLLPGVDVSAENEIVANITANKTEGQLTIFYGGKVLVFDNFPEEKVNNLMQMADKGNSKLSPTSDIVSLPEEKPTESHTPPPDLPMPIARRASLHRFFEKRKDRINSKAPYPVNESSTTKNTGDMAWLGCKLRN